MATTQLARRRFLMLSAAAAAGGALVACGGPATPAGNQAPAPAAQATAAPAAAATTAPAPTVASISVQNAAPTAAPTTAAAAATTAPAAGATTTASGKYKEAPQLADLVKQGKLPPVDQRIPQTPRVMTPKESIGQYGGTLHGAYRGLSDRWGPTKLQEEYLIMWDIPDAATIKLAPNIVEKWDQNADASEFTFYLRKGLKWSDGVEVTTDDTKFWLEDIQMNKDLTPAPSFVIRQKIGADYKMADVTIVDPYTFKVKYAAPNPLIPILMAKNGGGFPAEPAFLAPAHYLKKFHPKYADKATLDKAVSDAKLTSWTDLWGKAGDFQGPIAFWFLNPDVPILNAWTIKTPPASANNIVMVRNPFFHKVDPEGNQLPYVDEVDHAYFDDFEVLKLWVAQGKIDAQLRFMDPGAYTFFKENEKKGDYRTLNWRAASTDCYYFNINNPDPVLAKLFDTAEFRQAMNLAVNRQEIQQVVWNGLGNPRQYSPVKGSPEYDPEMEKVWTQYDPAAANQLLDKLGLTKGSDGMRKRPDGKPLDLVMEYIDAQGTPAVDSHNLVLKYWAAVGIKVTGKFVERALYEQHTHNGDVQVASGFGWDRSSVVKADPGRWTAEIDDGPWAPNYGHWYDKNGYKQQEPPSGHPILQIWDLWEKTQKEPDEAKRNAFFQQLIGVHKQHPYAVGTVGEKVQPLIARNNVGNVVGGFIADDTLRDIGQINPQTFFFKKS